MQKIMRKITYIFGLLMCIFFFSCEKEEFVTNSGNEDSGNDFYINPEDTAGIIVPEGYSLVIFPGNQAMTRAGSETRIQHLQYIIYQEDESGNYIQYEANKIIKQDLSSWPLKAEITSLPKNHTYKVVFLGNVDKSAFGVNQTEEVLIGTGKGTNYTDARIVLPIVEFSDNNMFFHAKADFNTNATAYVPITLKRIVSRNDITKEGLLTAYANGVTSDKEYKAAYLKQIVQEKMKQSIFTGRNSTFRYQMAESVKADLIYPLIYMGLAQESDANTLKDTYTAIGKYISEWDSYKPTNANVLKYIQDARGTYPDLVQAEYANNFCIRYAQYLYDTFVEEESKDNTSLEAALERIYSDNIDIKEGNFSVKSIDESVSKAIDALDASYTSGELLPWRNIAYNSKSIVQINEAMPMPGSVDFDLNVDAASNQTGNKYYSMKDAPDYGSDKYISLISFGEAATSSNKLGILKISSASSEGTNINHVPNTSTEIISTGFNAGELHRNIRSVTTQNISNVSLINPKSLMTGDTYKQKVEVSFYNVLHYALNPTENGTSLTIGNDTQFTIENIPASAKGKVANLQSLLLNYFNNSKYTNLSSWKDSEISFPMVTFQVPDLSPSNMNVTTTWTTSEVQ